MKLSSKVLLALSFFPSVWSESPMDEDPMDEVEANKDYFVDKVEATHSKHWTVSYEDTYKIVTNLAANETYLLYQVGTEPPQDAIDNGHAAVVQVPIEEVGLLYTTMIPFLELLGVRTSISEFLGYTAYIYSPCMSQLVDEGKVEEVLDPANTTLPSFVGHYGSYSFENAFRVSLTEEDENLASFEWIKFYSLFFNLEGEANRIFEATEGRYQCAEQNAAALSCDTENNKPIVLWGSYSSYCGGWSVAKCPNYYCEFAEACSATLLHSNEGSIESEMCGATYMTTEEFVAFGKDADYWIFTSPDYSNTFSLFKEELEGFKSVQNQEVYDTEGSGPGVWFEQRLAEPDVVLQDFCQIVGNENVASPVPHQRTWFRNVYTESVGQLGQCEDTSGALITRGTECTAVAADFCEKENDEENDEEEEDSGVAKRETLLSGLFAGAALIATVTV